jgi:NAD(P)-dependent dehydrogenase (short-subunit alcohol dehydrogenase family)
MDLNLGGKTVLITGASKGIGAAMAEVFAQEGCNLRLAARSEGALADLAKRLTADHGVRADVHAVDLRDAAALEQLADAASEVDILVNNAGDVPGGSLEVVDEATWRHAWELKVFGYINLTRRFYASMKARGHGVVVNIIGSAGERFDANYIAGATGNAALMTFTRALGGRSLDDGIRVVGVNPGPVETDRIVALMKRQAQARFGDESRYLEMMSRFPMGRAAKPREIADLTTYLASDRSAYTSGVVFTIDGGISARGG